MRIKAKAFGQEAFEFAEGVDRLEAPGDVIEALHRVVARFGFEGLFVGGIRADPNQSVTDLVIAAQCPAEFLEVYASRDYVRFDPTLQRALRSARPFEWTASRYDKEEPRLVGLVQLLADFRFSRGFIVPIHGPGGCEAGVGLAGEDIDLTTKTKPSIQLRALYAFERIRQLASAKFEEKSPLTRREREVLAWSAQGKSASEIGEILNVDKRTVDEHAQTALRKLGATNRTQAVALAIRYRLFEV